MDPQTGVVRFAFDQLYLFDGINIVVIAVGLFFHFAVAPGVIEDLDEAGG